MSNVPQYGFALRAMHCGWTMDNGGYGFEQGKRAVSILFSEVVRIKQQVVNHIYRRENEGL